MRRRIRFVLPQRSGQELGEKLKSEYPRVKVLCMSGYSQGDAADDKGMHKVGTILQKPFQQSELLKKMRQVLDA